MTPRLRDAAPGDAPLVRAMFAALQDHERTMEPNRLPGRDCGAHVEALLRWARGAGFVLIAELDGEPAGLLIAGTEDEGAYVLPENRVHGVVSDLYVAEGARRRGVARALLAEAERRFRAAGLARMEIGTLAANDAARALYEDWAGPAYAALYAKDLRAR